jgi:hypothetical protein
MLLVPRDDEVLSWMRVLENILDVVDPAKMESSTGGEWRAAIGRCVSSLQGNTGKVPTSSPSFPLRIANCVTSVAFFPRRASAHVADCRQTQSASGSRRPFFRRSPVPMSRRSSTSGEEPGPPGVLGFGSVVPTAATHVVQFSRGKHARGSRSLGRSGCLLMAGFDGIRGLRRGHGTNLLPGYSFGACW